jgi:large subunit ribosomal protein L31
MKKDIHPKVHNVIFLDTSCGVEFFATSTLTSEKTKEIDGVKYFVIPMEISSATHPFYTGKQIFIDTARRVEKFQKTMEKSADAAKLRKGKKAKYAKKTEVRKAKGTGTDTETSK